ncbi:MAG: thioredoxin family protein [Burkholderiales bacterium]|nr:thioredoxin family protein [Burkholderiales bacterium]
MTWAPIAIFAVIALFAATQGFMWVRAKRSVGQAAPDTSSVDGSAAGDPRRVYCFHSAHSGPCRAIKPLVERLRQTHRNLIPVDIAEQIELARKFPVAGTPSFVLVENGSVREVLLGGQSKRKLVAPLEGEIGTP